MTEAEYIALIITEIGDNVAGTLATNVPIYWSMRSAYADLALRYLIVKRDAIILMIGTLRKAVDVTSDGDTVKLSQQITNLRTLLELLDGELAGASSSSGASAAAGELTKAAPIMPPTGYNDSNAAVYRGSVYASRRRRP
jgi:hypothetical protein